MEMTQKSREEKTSESRVGLSLDLETGEDT